VVEEDEWLANDACEKTHRTIDALATALEVPEAA